MMGSQLIKNSTKIHVHNALLKFFNGILDSGIYPESWKHGFILPVYKKKDDKNECKNHRGITLVNTIAIILY